MSSRECVTRAVFFVLRLRAATFGAMRARGLLLVLLTLGCGSAPSPRPPDAHAAAPQASTAVPPDAGPAPVEPPSAPDSLRSSAVSAPAAGEMVPIPAGTLHVGSAPGTPWRQARDEADLVPVELPAFRIDRLPYPNDPSRPPTVGVTQPQAAQLCEAEGKRLCSELEWERACKGPSPDRPYPTGNTLDLDACRADPAACASPEGVLQLGAVGGEWTASPGNRGLDARTRVFRGAAPDPDRLHRHRCAARRAADPATQSPNLGFRCCAGPELTATYPTERAWPRFRRIELGAERIRAVLRAVPELASWADEFTPETDETMMRAVEAGDGVEALHGWELTGGALQWSPAPGERIWVLSGRSGDDALLAALYPLPDGTFRHGSSFILRGEATPIAVAFTPPSRGELLWSCRWGRLGEGGAITLREDGTVTVQHR